MAAPLSVLISCWGEVARISTKDDIPAKKKRVRWTLLVLLWAWALVMFLVIDLFLDVDEFDGVRPNSSLYRGMRRVAHRMVGTPYDDPMEETEATLRTAEPAPKVWKRAPRRGRRLHRYLPRGPDRGFKSHGTYSMWNDPPGKGEGEYREGARHGTWIWRWPGGGAQEKRHYERGVLHGKVTDWYAGGK